MAELPSGAGSVSKTVLIAEDNELSERLFREWLNARGYLTLRARDGNEALSLARRHRPGLVVMDTDLPGISGIEVARRMKEDSELRSIPVLAVTAIATSREVEMIREVGCEAYVTRPVTAGRFIDTVRRLLN